MKVLTRKLKVRKIVISSPSVSNIVLRDISSKCEPIVKWNHSMAKQISEPDMIGISLRVLRQVDRSRKLEKFLPKILYTKDIDRRIMQFRAMLSSE